MTITHADIRAMALALPEAVEADHHGSPSFRVAGRIFCTLRQDRPRLMVKLGPEHQENFVAGWPDLIEPVPGYWGRKGATFVEFSGLEETLIATLLRIAWAGVAPRRLTRS